MTTLTPATARNATLGEMIGQLKAMQAVTRDLVMPGRQIVMADDGRVTIDMPLPEPVLTDEGVTSTAPVALTVGPTAASDLATRYGIGTKYWAKMADGHTDLLAANVNRWAPLDGGDVTLRTLWDGTNAGYLRAVPSSRYAIFDNIDVLAATLDGLREAGIGPAQVDALGDITENRMRLRVKVPGVGVDVSDIVARYRNPHTLLRGADQPIMVAGVEISNSETGRGGSLLRPFVTFLVCNNGATMTQYAARQVHAGGRMDHGVITYSIDTQRKALALMAAKTRDAVAEWCTPAFLTKVADEMRGATQVQVSSPQTMIPEVIKAVGLPDSLVNDVFLAFTGGGDTSVMGIAQALTWVSQGVTDAELAQDMDAAFMPALAHGVRIATA